MKLYLHCLASFWLWLRVIAAINPHTGPSTTVAQLPVRYTENPSPGRVAVAAVKPTQPGQIEISPPESEPTPANIEAHSKYFTLEQGTTKWIGVDSKYIAVTTITTTNKPGETVTATIMNGVTASKNAAGNLDILLSPSIQEKLKRQGGPACGLVDYVQRVAADAELRANFARPLTNQVLQEEYDSGYESGPGSEDGWVEGAGSEGGAESLVQETIAFATEEEAVALGAALSGSEAATYALILADSSLTTVSFLARVWHFIQSGKEIPNAHQIPKQSFHRVTKTKTKTTTRESSTTTSTSCPTGTPPSCGGECRPTSIKVENPEVTGLVKWACSEGETKGCDCLPKVVTRVTLVDTDFHQAVLGALQDVREKPQEPLIECPGELANVPSQFFLDTTSKDFCQTVMGDLKVRRQPAPYDIYGNKKPILQSALATQEQTEHGLKGRSPPETIKSYKDYNIFPSYAPLDGKCLVDEKNLCRNAWKRLVKSNSDVLLTCGSNQGSAGDRMFKHGSVDVGCGKFTWQVEKPPQPQPKISLGKRECHKRHSHHDVHQREVVVWANRLCPKDRMMKPGDEAIHWRPSYHSSVPGLMNNDYFFNFKVSWIDGCKVRQEQNVTVPIEDNKSLTCAKLLTENYLACNNGGAGGRIDAGCLRYDFFVDPK